MDPILLLADCVYDSRMAYLENESLPQDASLSAPLMAAMSLVPI